MQQYPLWATPLRRQQLVEMFQSGAFCVFGEGEDCPCHKHQGKVQHLRQELHNLIPWLQKHHTHSRLWVRYGATIHALDKVGDKFLAHSFDVVSEQVIEDWKAGDRLERSIAWQQEKRRMYAAPLQKLYRRGQFDSIARDIYLANRPTFRVLAIGLHAFTQHTVAKVEIPGLEKIVWVNISGAKLSKNKLRKLFRHHKGAVPEEVSQIIQRKVGSYL